MRKLSAEGFYQICELAYWEQQDNPGFDFKAWLQDELRGEYGFGDYAKAFGLKTPEQIINYGGQLVSEIPAF